MDFVFDKHTPLPAFAQIQEQVKLALLLGKLRPGDTLPSIRDVEKQCGISRNIVRKAYIELHNSGILNLKQGKGVLVEKDLDYSHRAGVREDCQRIAEELFAKLLRAGISPIAFSRFFSQHARDRELKSPSLVFVDATKWMAEERAATISSIWQVTIPGISLEELASFEPSQRRKLSKVLTNYLRRDQVIQIMRRCPAEVIPIGLGFEPETHREFGKIPGGASVVLVLDDRDHPALGIIMELYRRILLEPSVKISSIPLSKINHLDQFVRSSKYHKVIFSNRVWAEIPEKLRKHPKVTHPQMTIDLASLEGARIRAGIIL